MKIVARVGNGLTITKIEKLRGKNEWMVREDDTKGTEKIAMAECREAENPAEIAITVGPRETLKKIGEPTMKTGEPENAYLRAILKSQEIHYRLPTTNNNSTPPDNLAHTLMPIPFEHRSLRYPNQPETINHPESSFLPKEIYRRLVT